MICIIPPDTLPSLPSRMSFSPAEEGWSTGSDRPTLPSIRDLFSEELSGSPRLPLESPSLTLSRLRVSDDEPTSLRGVGSPGPSYMPGPSTRSQGHYEYTSPAMSGSFFEHRSTPYYRDYYAHSKSRSYTDLPTSQRSEYPIPGRSMTYDTSSPRLSHGLPPPHRNTIATGDHRYDSRASRYLYDEPSPHFSGLVSRATPSSSGSSPLQRPIATISTSVEHGRNADDDDQTPIALYRESGPSFGHPLDEKPVPSHSKYECNYCGKGFNRPSSLKIHINSHTGEKPFVCNFEGCGRSFSVLSNMRRHQRVHTQLPTRQAPDSSDEAPSPPSTASSFASTPSTSIPARISNARWKRRDSTASTSSASSRRSRSVSSDDDDDEAPRQREKRSRHLH